MVLHIFSNGIAAFLANALSVHFRRVNRPYIRNSNKQRVALLSDVVQTRTARAFLPLRKSVLFRNDLQRKFFMQISQKKGIKFIDYLSII